MATIAKSSGTVNAAPTKKSTDATAAGTATQFARHPTLTDVAMAAGVSTSTASRALRERPFVREATRRRVLDAARELGFEPNRLARSLRTRSSLSVGVVVPDVATVFWAAALKGAQDVLEEAGYLVLVMSSERDPAHEQTALRTLIAHRVDGILLATSGGYEPPPGVPVVLFDRLGPEPASGRAALANEEGMALLFEHLRSHGHERIGYLGGYPGSTSADERRDAFSAAAAAAGLRLPAGYVRHGDPLWSEASGAAIVAEMLREDGPPTALIAASDALAVGALRALHRAGVRVPEQVALVSFDEPLFADLLDPPLTALARHDRQLGAVAAELLLQVLRGEAEGPEVRVPLELIVRRSCGCG